MQVHRLVGCLCLLAFCVPIAADDKQKEDEKAIQGSWDLFSVGEAKPALPVITCERLVFKGDKLTFHYKMGDQRFTSECTFKLDPTVTPKTIDFVPTDGTNKGKTYLGLYDFKEGRLWFCYRGPESTRPKNFDDKRQGNNDTVFYTFEPTPKK